MFSNPTTLAEFLTPGRLATVSIWAVLSALIYPLLIAPVMEAYRLIAQPDPADVF